MIFNGALNALVRCDSERKNVYTLIELSAKYLDQFYTRLVSAAVWAADRKKA